MMPWLIKRLKTSWRIFWEATKTYIDTDGEQRAASFAYYSFFAIFPLLLLVVMAGSLFYDYPVVTNNVMDMVSTYVPSISGDPETRSPVLDAVNGVIDSRRSASAVALVVVFWCSLGFFHALVRGVNRAWGTLEYPWYKLPFKNLFMVGIVCSALVIGIIAPVIMSTVEALLWKYQPGVAAKTASFVFQYAKLLVPTFVLFYGFTMFYKFAPRQRPKFLDVWSAALFVTIGLQVLQKLFVLYATNVTSFNKFYGAFGGVIAFLLWIYLSGSLIIFGGCLSAARYKVLNGTKEPEESGIEEKGKD
jgi:Ca2+-transporting ATPase